MRSPLRYPGGKAKDVPFLSQFLPTDISAYVEPFLGGGSMLLWVVQRRPDIIYLGGDLNPALIDFWRMAQIDPSAIANHVRPLIGQYQGPAKNCPEWQEFKNGWLLPRIDSLPSYARFFALNRCTSGGATESGGITAAAYCGRFTKSSVDRVLALKLPLGAGAFGCWDYAALLCDPPKRSFIFLDPPYYSAEKSGLYGKNGDLHRGFDHARLASVLAKVQHRWLMTIDDDPHIRELYAGYHILPWQKTYSMRRGKGQELLIANYPLEKP